MIETSKLKMNPIQEYENNLRDLISLCINFSNYYPNYAQGLCIDSYLCTNYPIFCAEINEIGNLRLEQDLINNY